MLNWIRYSSRTIGISLFFNWYDIYNFDFWGCDAWFVTFKVIWDLMVITVISSKVMGENTRSGILKDKLIVISIFLKTTEKGDKWGWYPNAWLIGFSCLTVVGFISRVHMKRIKGF